MAPVLAFRPTMTTDITPAVVAADAAICPGCHTADPSMTMTILVGGAAWQCGRCMQRWDIDRLTAVANYAAWAAARTPAPLSAVTSSIEGTPATRMGV
jgi:hypothetical protein